MIKQDIDNYNNITIPFTARTPACLAPCLFVCLFVFALSQTSLMPRFMKCGKNWFQEFAEFSCHDSLFIIFPQQVMWVKKGVV